MTDIFLLYDIENKAAAKIADLLVHKLRFFHGVTMSTSSSLDDSRNSEIVQADTVLLVTSVDLLENQQIVAYLKQILSNGQTILIILCQEYVRSFSCLRDVSNPDTTNEGDEISVEVINGLTKCHVVPFTLDYDEEVCREILRYFKRSNENSSPLSQKIRDVSSELLLQKSKIGSNRRYDLCFSFSKEKSGKTPQVKICAKMLEALAAHAPASQIRCTVPPNDGISVRDSGRVGMIKDSSMLVILLTPEALLDSKIRTDIKAALDADIKVVLLDVESQCCSFNEHGSREILGIDTLPDASHKVALLKATIFPVFIEYVERTVLRLLESIQIYEPKSPRMRATGVAQHRVFLKSFLAFEIPREGRLSIYRKRGDKAQKLPTDVETQIRNLYELFDQQKTGCFDLCRFEEVYRIMVESIGGHYSEMLCLRTYSFMLYPGIPLSASVTSTTFFNYFSYIARRMGACSGDKDVSTHFQYCVAKMKYLTKTKRFSKKYDVAIVGAETFISKGDDVTLPLSNTPASVLKSSMGSYTPNIRACILGVGESVGSTYNVLIPSSLVDTHTDDLARVVINCLKESVTLVLCIESGSDINRIEDGLSKLQKAVSNLDQHISTSDGNQSPVPIKQLIRLSYFLPEFPRNSCLYISKALDFPDCRPFPPKGGSEEIGGNPYGLLDEVECNQLGDSDTSDTEPSRSVCLKPEDVVYPDFFDEPSSNIRHAKDQEDVFPFSHILSSLQEETKIIDICHMVGVLTNQDAVNRQHYRHEILVGSRFLGIISRTLREHSKCEEIVESVFRILANSLSGCPPKGVRWRELFEECEIVKSIVFALEGKKLPSLIGEAIRATRAICAIPDLEYIFVTENIGSKVIESLRFVAEGEPYDVFKSTSFAGRVIPTKELVTYTPPCYNRMMWAGEVVDSDLLGNYQIEHYQKNTLIRTFVDVSRICRFSSDHLREQFFGSWLWSPNGYVEGELLIKSDGMCSLSSGAVGTWYASNIKEKPGFYSFVSIGVGGSVWELGISSETTLSPIPKSGEVVDSYPVATKKPEYFQGVNVVYFLVPIVDCTSLRFVGLKPESRGSEQMLGSMDPPSSPALRHLLHLIGDKVGRNSDNFNVRIGARWECLLEISEEGNYTFSVNSKKSCTVTILDQTILHSQDNTTNENEIINGSIYLTIGFHSLKVEYVTRLFVTHNIDLEPLDLKYRGKDTGNLDIPITSSRLLITDIRDSTKKDGLIVECFSQKTLSGINDQLSDNHDPDCVSVERRFNGITWKGLSRPINGSYGSIRCSGYIDINHIHPSFKDSRESMRTVKLRIRSKHECSIFIDEEWHMEVNEWFDVQLHPEPHFVRIACQPKDLVVDFTFEAAVEVLDSKNVKDVTNPDDAEGDDDKTDSLGSQSVIDLSGFLFHFDSHHFSVPHFRKESSDLSNFVLKMIILVEGQVAILRRDGTISFEPIELSFEKLVNDEYVNILPENNVTGDHSVSAFPKDFCVHTENSSYGGDRTSRIAVLYDSGIVFQYEIPGCKLIKCQNGESYLDFCSTASGSNSVLKDNSQDTREEAEKETSRQTSRGSERSNVEKSDSRHSTKNSESIDHQESDIFIVSQIIYHKTNCLIGICTGGLLKMFDSKTGNISATFPRAVDISNSMNNVDQICAKILIPVHDANIVLAGRSYKTSRTESYILVTGGTDGSIRLWDLSTPDCIREASSSRDTGIGLINADLSGSSGAMNELEIQSNIGGHSDSRSRNVTPRPKCEEITNAPPYTVLAHSSAILSLDVLLRKMDTECLSESREIPVEMSSSADLHYQFLCITSSTDFTVKIFELQRRENLLLVQIFTTLVSWAPDGYSFISIDNSIGLMIRSSITGKVRDYCHHGLSPITRAGFSHSGFHLISCSADGFSVSHVILNSIMENISHIEQEELQLSNWIISFAKYIEFLRCEVKSIARVNDVEFVKKFESTQSMMKYYTEKIPVLNSYQTSLGVTRSSYSDFYALKVLYEPHGSIWYAAISIHTDIQKWTNTPLSGIDAESVETSLDVYTRDIARLVKSSKTHGSITAATTSKEMKGLLDAFREKFPFIRAFCSNAILNVHWDILFRKMGITKFMEYDCICLTDMMQWKLFDYKAEFEAISAGAFKEFSLRKSMNLMKNEWSSVEFQTTLYKNTGCQVLKSVDDIQTILDDHLVKSQTIRSSPFCAPFEKEIQKWENNLLYIQQLLDQCLELQKEWMQLEPIFTSGDISRQLPNESEIFQKVDKTFRMRMQQVADNPGCILIAEDKTIVSDIKEANSGLEVIQKGLKDYLETKRLVFPRFYFLNDADLLSILAETKDPTLVRPHLGKAFEGLVDIEFDDRKDNIMSMISAENECVSLISTVNVNSERNRGNVEIWLSELEKVMIETLRKVIGTANEDYTRMPRTDWCVKYPGQVVIATDCIFWTHEVEQALKSNTLESYEEKLGDQLMELVELVRGELTKAARTTLSALVTIDVHARDVVSEMMQNNVASFESFDWLSQLRYYWRKSESGEMECAVSIVNSTLLYGFEYLGNNPRLVITPLTDRCYRTLMGAYALYYGGAPEGPAGTGKTESTKDLAKALAIQCVVFNCSDGMDYMQMAKFFKGLASSGAWCCFDEFNRINLEVLSVIAQQIQCISLAIRQKAKVFEFEGTDIRLIPTCAVNITMNPGYAGRSELPDNLKALFRPCAMMVPNYALIAEITLYSYGYKDARRIGIKATQALKLSSEQLSSQDHYDFGMRGLKSLLVAAGQLKMKCGELYDEDSIALRAFTDVNLPKFAAHDIPLFKGIIGDLFPGVILPPNEYGPLMSEIETSAISFQLQPTPQLVKKVIQLWETISVRHGLMTVGHPPCGKTSVKNVLAETLRRVSETEKDSEIFLPVVQHIINPKSITQGQLYGEADEITREWSDGVLAIAVRTASKGRDRHWIVLDGPVDAIWIENMNTVLDDNKKLCLNSGEIIKLSPNTTMIFEVGDLSAASPATVSRCGMLFLEPGADLGWQPIVDSWIQFRVRISRQKLFLKSLFQSNFDCIMEIVSRLSCPIPVTSGFLADSMCRLMESIFKDMNVNDSESQNEVDGSGSIDGRADSEMELLIYQIYFFSVVWTCGVCTDVDGRVIIDGVVRSFYSNKKDKVQSVELNSAWAPIITSSGLNPPPLPTSGSVYEYFISLEDGGSWLHWSTKIEKLSFDIANTEYHNIIVPTVDTVRNQYLLKVLVSAGHSVLFSGATGTGKTTSMKNALDKMFDASSYSSIRFAFSAQTTANQTQDVIDGKLEKRKKGVYGPLVGKTLLIFIDDVSLPTKEVYGAQPPIELLRQAVVQGGWYDRKTWDFKSLVDTVFLSSMSQPGEGRNSISDRYVRHFNLVMLTPFDDECLSSIFKTIMSEYLSVCPREVSGLCEKLVDSTISLYHRLDEEMLPTPEKSHYSFNLRDISRVFQGISVCTRESLPHPDDLLRVWSHECQRVFSDRFIIEGDHKWFKKTLKATSLKHFKKDLEEIIKDPLIFTDFVDDKTNNYQLVKSQGHVVTKLSSIIEDYNSESKIKLNLVLFDSFVEHVCRMVRVLRLPLGHSLCVGVGGSGRRSVTTLAGYICGYRLFSISISSTYGVQEWRDDMRKLLLSVGTGQESGVVFLLPDTQILHESFLEDISSLLNTGEIPNLFQTEDKLEIIEKCSALASSQGRSGPAEIFSFFIEQCRKRLHIVLAVSPIGEKFRVRLRMFPSVVNCCTIDWYLPWPSDALVAVAREYLKEIEFPGDILSGVVNTVVDIQVGVGDLVSKYREEMRRYYYVTPTSYLEFIDSFKNMLVSQRESVHKAKWRYDVGLEKLEETSSQVFIMQKELEDLQPVLENAAKETNEMMILVEKQQVQAAAKQKLVDEEAALANEQASKAEAIAADCEKDLAIAMPALESAIDALSKLSKGDITEVKAMKTPPGGVVLVCQALCCMFSVKPSRIPSADGKGKVDDYWEPAKKELLSDPRLLEKLSTYDKDNIPAEIISKVKPLYDDPAFDPEVIKKASIAAMGICKWVRAMVVYDKVAREVAPKTMALAAAQADAQKAKDKLEVKKSELAGVIQLVDRLVADLDSAKKKMTDLQKQKDDCAAKLVRAEKLIVGLGGEKSRWESSSLRLQERYDNLTGDILISSGTIAYLGVFVGSYRSQAIDTWTEILSTSQIITSPQFSLQACIGEPVEIRQWIIDKLPNDSISIDNAIILRNSRRWPLMIDPQQQANKWIRHTNKSDLKIIRLGSHGYSSILESAIRMGFPVLIENIEETIDPLLDDVLARRTFRDGNIEKVMLGDTAVDWSTDFRLFVTTKLANPHYAPEICVSVTILNFMATIDGLQDQLLGLVVAVENPEVEERRGSLIVESARAKAQLKEVEDRILALLSSASGNILEDEELIQTLSDSKVTSDMIEEQVHHQERTAIQIQETRESYQPIARRSAALFFAVSDLCILEPMYQYSLDWFIEVYLSSINRAPKSPILEERLKFLAAEFLKILFSMVCRSLYGEHHLVFALQLATKLQEVDKELNQKQLRLLLSGSSGDDSTKIKPTGENLQWLTTPTWNKILDLDSLGLAFSGFSDNLVVDIVEWKSVFDSVEPMKVDWPRNMNDTLTATEKALVLSAIRPDALVPSIQAIVSNKLGEFFVEPQSSNTEDCFHDSTPHKPIVFVLSSGSDPMADVLRIAEKMNFLNNVIAISLGQGQGNKALAAVEEGAKTGKWVILQNCHLATSWMPTLERLVEELSKRPILKTHTTTFVEERNQQNGGKSNDLSSDQEPMNGLANDSNIDGNASPDSLSSHREQKSESPEIESRVSIHTGEDDQIRKDSHDGEEGMGFNCDVVEEDEEEKTRQSLSHLHPNFRLWLTSMPSPSFPVSVLQNSIKVTVEPPKGLKQSVLRAYSSISDDWLDDCRKSKELKKLVFCLCMFHAVILERRQFGPLGWNIAYQFTETDREICRLQLKNFLNEFDGIPWDALRYMAAEANYGGRVTDSQDRRLINEILKDYYNPNVLDNDYRFSTSDMYYPPPEGNVSSCIEYIKQLPMEAGPEIFWLHNNAILSARIQKAMSILGFAASMMPKGGFQSEGDQGTVDTHDQVVIGVCEKISQTIPEPFAMDKVGKRYPVKYSQCLNTVINQEAAKMNRLILKIIADVSLLNKAIRGLVAFTSYLEELSESIFNNKVPTAWMQFSYPSLKPLSSYIPDLVKRAEFFGEWIDGGTPNVFWFSAFFFQQAFLTAVLQNYAREYKIAIDTLVWKCEILSEADGDPQTPPTSGCYIRGLYLEGARFDSDTMALSDSFSKVLYSEMPIIWVKPIEMENDTTNYNRVYSCPVYKTSERRGTLSTSGHSTNFIMTCHLPIMRDHSENFWTKRGVALLTQIDD